MVPLIVHTKIKIEENFSVVQPVEYIIDARAKRIFQHVPVLKSLSHSLQNKNVLQKAVESTETSKHGVTLQYKSFHDGSYFKESSPVSGDEFRVSLILYVDDFEICNPLGTFHKKHKITAVYWVLGNIPSELWSELMSVHLAVFCQADDVKTHGYSVVLEPILKDFAFLESEGIFITSIGRNVKGTVMCVVADNLAAHSIGRFVESFLGQYPCRVCFFF